MERNNDGKNRLSPDGDRDWIKFIKGRNLFNYGEKVTKPRKPKDNRISIKLCRTCYEPILHKFAGEGQYFDLNNQETAEKVIYALYWMMTFKLPNGKTRIQLMNEKLKELFDVTFEEDYADFLKDFAKFKKNHDKRLRSNNH